MLDMVSVDTMGREAMEEKVRERCELSSRSRMASHSLLMITSDGWKATSFLVGWMLTST